MNKNHVYARRLLKLADYISGLPRKKFDFSVWGRKEPSCGTVGCALGHACMMPEFRRLGARLVMDPDDTAGTTAFCQMKGSDGEVQEEIFGVQGYRDYAFLFIPGGSDEKPNGLTEEATPKQVAKNIRKYVKEKYPEYAQ